VISAAGSVAYYLNISYVPTYLDSIANVPHAEALRWGTIAGFAVIGVSLLAGGASDRFGRRRTLAVIGLALVVSTIPLFALLGGESEGLALAAVLALAVPAGAWSAVAAAAVPEQLPSRVRFTGLAVGYNTAVAIFGGLTPLAATVLVEWTGAKTAPAFLVVVVAIAALLALRGRRETAGLELEELN
jgi:MHS family proline/betaine transporter-like MFS transporter